MLGRIVNQSWYLSYACSYSKQVGMLPTDMGENNPALSMSCNYFIVNILIFCEACGVDFIPSVSGADNGCYCCQTGFSANTDLSSSRVCVPCDAGTFNPSAGSVCQSCGVGQFSPYSSAVSCQSCYPGNHTTVIFLISRPIQRRYSREYG